MIDLGSIKKAQNTSTAKLFASEEVEVYIFILTNYRTGRT